MKKMSKLIRNNIIAGIKGTFILILMLCVCVFFVCGCTEKPAGDMNNSNGNDGAESSVHINVAVMKGPTAIGMVKLMDEASTGNAEGEYAFTVAASADEFGASLIKGDINIAALPCNAAATLYNKSNGKIKLLAVNTLGVLYILDNDGSINSINDLKGRTIYSTGKGTTPEYTLKYLLDNAGLDESDLTIEFKQEASEVATIMAMDSTAVAMLPQPYVATVLTNNKTARIALDVTKEWEKVSGGTSTVVTGVIAVNSEFYDNNREAVELFAKEYGESVNYVTSNVDKASELVEQQGIFKAEIAKKAIPYCNIVYIDGEQMKTKVEKYLKVLYDANPLSVGSKLPDEDFYIKM